MLHCVACNKSINAYSNYCDECLEAIADVYTGDSKFVSFMKGTHPTVLDGESILAGKFPDDFYDWESDIDTEGEEGCYYGI